MSDPVIISKQEFLELIDNFKEIYSSMLTTHAVTICEPCMVVYYIDSPGLKDYWDTAVFSMIDGNPREYRKYPDIMERVLKDKPCLYLMKKPAKWE